MLKKVMYLIVCMLTLMQSVCSAGCVYSGCVLGGSYAVSGPDYSDITFYHNCDALGDATKAVGSATVSYDGGILLETTSPIVGSGSWDNNNDGYDSVSFAVASNISFTSGRLGMYVAPKELAAGFMFDTNVSGDFACRYASATAVQVNWRGKTSGNYIDLSITMDTSTTYFFEWKFDGDTVSLYIDGSLQGTVVSSSVEVTATEFHVSDYNYGAAWDMWYDQIIYSNDKDRSLYAVRDVTDFS